MHMLSMCVQKTVTPVLCAGVIVFLRVFTTVYYEEDGSKMNQTGIIKISKTDYFNITKITYNLPYDR